MLALQSGFTLDQFGARPFVGRLVSASMIKELGPVLTALMLVGRVSSGIAAELGAMVVTDQINALRALGTDPMRKLVVPRVLAGILMTPVLTVVANAVGLVGGWIVSVQYLKVPSGLYWSSVVDGLYMEDVWMGVLKPLFLGFIIVTVGCHLGLRARGGTQGVGPGHHQRRGHRVGERHRHGLLLDAAAAVDLLLMPSPTSVRAGTGHAPLRASSPWWSSKTCTSPSTTRSILNGISFKIYPGFTKIFLGASGAGKSTILKLILGLLPPDSGRIWVHGSRIDGMREEELLRNRDQTGMVFQEGALFDSLTVGENVGFKLYEDSDLPLDEVRQRVEETLGFVGLGEYVDRMPSELSGGQRRRVAIARAMATKPPLLLYDEPTAGLDPITSLTIGAEIVKLRDLEGGTAVLVTHQLRDAFYIARHVASAGPDGVGLHPAAPEKVEQADFVMLRDGRLMFEGSVDELTRVARSLSARIPL